MLTIEWKHPGDAGFEGDKTFAFFSSALPENRCPLVKVSVKDGDVEVRVGGDANAYVCRVFAGESVVVCGTRVRITGPGSAEGTAEIIPNGMA